MARATSARVRAADGRNAQRISRHLHRGREPRQLPRALELREAAAQLSARPQGAEARGDEQHDKSHEQNAKQPASHPESIGSRQSLQASRPPGCRS